MKEEQFRNKITWFTFGYSLLVIWVHSYNGELFLGKTSQGQAVAGFERFFGDSIGQIAVPGFFLISAYLFYRNFTWGKLGAKWASRAKSILIPYIVWNVLYYGAYVIGSRLPGISRVMGKGKLSFSLGQLLDVIVHYRYLYVFWYLHQLILLVALAPLLYAVLKYFWSGLLFLGAVFGAVWAAADFPWLNEDALFYYRVGAFMALHGRRWEKAWNRGRWLLGIGLLGAGVMNLYLTRKYFLPGTTVAYRTLLPLGLWLLADEGRLSPARPWMDCNFFLYAVHFAFVRLVNKGAALLLPKRVFVPVAIYLVMPGLMVGISYGLAVLVRRYAPGAWKVLNGWR